MRIAIVGTQCTGKTTLIKSLKESTCLPLRYKIKDEVVRTLGSQIDLKINKDFDFKSQGLIFLNHMENVLDCTDMITDRSCIDAFVYTTYNYKKGKLTEAQYNYFKSLFELNLPYYDKIFYLPVEFELVSDGFRSTDERFRVDIDVLFREIFCLFKIKPVILEGDLTERNSKFFKIFHNEENKRNI